MLPSAACSRDLRSTSLFSSVSSLATHDTSYLRCARSCWPIATCIIFLQRPFAFPDNQYILNTNNGQNHRLSRDLPKELDLRIASNFTAPLLVFTDVSRCFTERAFLKFARPSRFTKGAGPLLLTSMPSKRSHSLGLLPLSAPSSLSLSPFCFLRPSVSTSPLPRLCCGLLDVAQVVAEQVD